MQKYAYLWALELQTKKLNVRLQNCTNPPANMTTQKHQHYATMWPECIMLTSDPSRHFNNRMQVLEAATDAYCHNSNMQQRPRRVWEAVVRRVTDTSKSTHYSLLHSLITSTLLMEADTTSETFDIDSNLTGLIAREVSIVINITFTI
jgi:hypothetical protein